MDDYPGQIDWSEHSSPAEWFAVPGNPGGHTSPRSWTLSPDPNVPGWSTDCGCGGYGLPREIAERLAERLNAAPPRPWHYVTEKLPEPGQRVLFWVARTPHLGIHDPVGANDMMPWKSTSGMRWVTAAEVYAWQLVPEPPLPEVQHA